MNGMAIQLPNTHRIRCTIISPLEEGRDLAFINSYSYRLPACYKPREALRNEASCPLEYVA